MINQLKRVFIVTIVASLCACSSPDIKSYTDNRPAFVPEEFFSGQLTAHGLLKNRRGEVTRYFNATIDASWDQGVGTLAERFEFNDGEIQYRTWVLTPDGPGSYLATAEDVVGTATAQTSGNALQLDYTLQVDYRGRQLDLRVEDWMWRVDAATVINHSTLRKWGFRVGSIHLVIVKQTELAPRAGIE